jgi:kinesin family protein 4/21/27
MDLRSRLEKANDMVAQLQQRLEASLKQQSADKEMFDQIRHEWERDAEIQNLRLQEATQRDAQQRISDLKAVLERERAESAQKFASQVREHQDQLSSLRSSHESALRKCRMECDDAMRQLLMEKDAEILALQKTLERFQLSSNEDVTRFQRLEREWATKLSLKETEIRHLVSQIEEERMLRSQEASRSHGELKEREARLQALVEQERLHAELQRQAFEDWKSEASRASDETLKCALDAQQRLFADEVSQLRTSLSGSLKDREELEAQFRKVLNDAIALEQKKSKTMLEDAEVRFLALQREQERWAAAYHDAMHAQEHTESTLSQLKKTSDLQLSELRTKVLFLEKEISLLVEQQKQAVTSKEIASVATELKRTVARMQAADDASDTAFTCMECMNILHDPVTYYPCGHTFCLKCAGDRREGKGKYPCQECSTLVTGIAKNYAVDQLLGKREFRKQAVSSLAELSSKLLQDTERTSQ